MTNFVCQNEINCTENTHSFTELQHPCRATNSKLRNLFGGMLKALRLFLIGTVAHCSKFAENLEKLKLCNAHCTKFTENPVSSIILQKLKLCNALLNLHNQKEVLRDNSCNKFNTLKTALVESQEKLPIFRCAVLTLLQNSMETSKKAKKRKNFNKSEVGPSSKVIQLDDVKCKNEDDVKVVFATVGAVPKHNRNRDLKITKIRSSAKSVACEVVDLSDDDVIPVIIKEKNKKRERVAESLKRSVKRHGKMMANFTKSSSSSVATVVDIDFESVPEPVQLSGHIVSQSERVASLSWCAGLDNVSSVIDSSLKEEIEEKVSKLKNLRQWEYTQFGEKWEQERERNYSFGRPGEAVTFTVMSYNVLAQKLLEEHAYLYRECDPRALSWNIRWMGLLREFRESNPDIICLQEVQADHYQPYFEKELIELGYEGIYKKRTGDKVDGCALFYKTSVFVLVESASVEYCQPGDELLSKDNIALVVKLSPVFSRDQEICVATTHLLYNPRRHDIKLAQLQVLCAEIDRIACCRINKSGVPKYVPIIVTGDMNFEPRSNPYEFVTKGVLSYSELGDRNFRFVDRFSIDRFLDIADSCQHVSVMAERLKSAQSKCYGQKYCVDRSAEVSKLKIYHSDNKTGKNYSDSCSSLAPDVKVPGQTKVETEGTAQSPQHYKSFEEFLEAVKSKGGVNNFVEDFGASAVPHVEPDVKKEDDNSHLFDTGTLTHNLCLRSTYKHRLKRLNGDREVTTHQRDWTTVDYIFYSVYFNNRLQKRIEGHLKMIGKYGLLAGPECQSLGCLPNLASPSDHLPLHVRFLLKPKQ